MSWMLWSDQTHDMFPEYMGYLAPLDENGQPEGPTIDDVTHAIGIEDFANCHGKYNCGPTAMPAMAKVGDNAFVAVWCSVDELNIDGSSNLNYFKLFASASDDGGRTWDHQVQLTTNFMFQMSECVYPQAAVVGNTLVVAAQFDNGTGSFVQNDDTESGDNYYQGLTFELTDLFPGHRDLQHHGSKRDDCGRPRRCQHHQHQQPDERYLLRQRWFRNPEVHCEVSIHFIRHKKGGLRVSFFCRLKNGQTTCI